MIYLFGLLLAFSSLLAAVAHLHQQAQYFWDFVAFACVTGGTTAVALMTFPWQYRRLIARSFFALFATGGEAESGVVADCVEFFKSVRAGKTHYEGDTSSLAGEVLRDGSELMTLGFGQEKVHQILEDRIHQSFERLQKVAMAVRSLAKYPPAFGLAGTILGLVSLMRNVSAGADAKQTGLMMSIALMATFYGILTSNLLVNPTGESMAKSAVAEKKKAEIALHTILLLMEGATLLEAQEVLNSYVTKEQRVNLIGGFESEAA